MKTNVWQIAALVFLVWAIVGSSLAAEYYLKWNSQTTIIQNIQSYVNSTSMSVEVNIAIDYSNGTISWYNNTVQPIGSNLLAATSAIATVNDTYYPNYGEYFINSINGVLPGSNQYWGWSTYQQGTWTSGTVGADKYLLHNNEILEWKLTGY
jgi:phage-related protein